MFLLPLNVQGTWSGRALVTQSLKVYKGIGGLNAVVGLPANNRRFLPPTTKFWLSNEN